MYARKEDRMIEAAPGQRAECPHCRAEVLAKCGTVMVWHWAHVSIFDCDSWSEGETAWHMNWKRQFPQECREISVGSHRADVLVKGKTIYEFQSKSLPTPDMLERERYYRRLGYVYFWVFNLSEKARHFSLRKSFSDGHWSFRWYHGWKRLDGIAKPFYLDLGSDGLFFVKSIRFDGSRCFGFGKLKAAGGQYGQLVKHEEQKEVAYG